MYTLKMDGYQRTLLLEALEHIQKTYLHSLMEKDGDCTDESQAEDLAKLIQQIQDLKKRS